MKIESYEDLIVWQKAMSLTTEVYRLVKLLPKEETYALSDQMRRAAVSIPSNIAEGQSRGSTKEFVYFLGVASGSVAELNTQLLICERTNLLLPDTTAQAKKLCAEIGKMLHALSQSLPTAQ